MLINLIYTLLGGLTFRIRGGLRIPFMDKKFPLNKWYFAVYFACLACTLRGWSLSFLITGLVAGKICTSISGWGSYIGALYSGKISETDKDDLNITDFVQNKLFPLLNKLSIWTYNHKYTQWINRIVPFIEKDYKECPRAYGFLTLSLRGGLTTFILGLWLNSIPFCLVGLLQGTVYWFGGWTCSHIYNDGKYGWKISEWYWGIVLSLFLLLI